MAMSVSLDVSAMATESGCAVAYAIDAMAVNMAVNICFMGCSVGLFACYLAFLHLVDGVGGFVIERFHR